MAEETQISTPVDESDVTTSSSEVSTEETTSQDEITTETQTAETETEKAPAEEQPEEKLYAGKYKSIEELEKGYAEAQKTLTQNLQIKAKYDELVKKQEQQEARLLQKAQQQGFNTVNDQKIAQQVAQAEYDEFVKGLNYYVEPDNQVQVQQYLGAYFQTGDTRYLNEAKRYYPSDFLENVAVGKLNLQNQLKSQYEKETSERIAKAEQELADTLKTDYADFIETVKGNKGASKALELFCNAGLIQSKDDMDMFKTVYDDIVSFVKEQAIKEYQAQITIDKTKQGAQIGTGSNVADGVLDTMPTPEQLEKMTPEQYDKAVAKYGLQKLFG